MARPQEGRHHLGAGPAWRGTQRLHLSPQPGRSGGRVLYRARQDAGRGARLFRSQALACRSAATAQRVGSAIRGPPLGTAANARFPARPRRARPGLKLGAAMIKVSRIGHATFETPDLDKAIDYYTSLVGLTPVGREANRAFFASR